MKTKQSISRRQWIAGLLRGGLLTVFGTTAFHLLRRDSTVRERECLDPEGYIGCRGCLDLNKCKLPRALSVKAISRKDRNHGKSIS